jgi:translation initiation factor 5B
MYDWKIDKDAPYEDTFAAQADHVKHEFREKTNAVIADFANQGMNACLYTENNDYENFVSLVPTSAITGEGIPDLLGLIAVMCQRRLSSEIQFSVDVQATVLEVKVIEGLGTTIDIILINGQLYSDDEIVVCTMNGPVLTKIRALLTPEPMKEIRVKGSYQRHESIKAAMGIKIAATEDLSGVVAGTPLFVVRGDDDEEDIKAEAEEAFEEMLEDDYRSEHGVYVQASTLGSLEALLRFLREDCGDPIPYAAVNIGPVHKKDVMKASTMCGKHQEHAVILAFDVKIMPEAALYAEEVGVTIFSADIIYHLFDSFIEYRDSLKQAAKEEAQAEAVFPCVLQIYEQHVFNARNPILVGAKVLDGQPKIGTPICIPSADFISIGRVVSMEKDHKEVTTASKGDDIAVKIEQNANDQEYYYGRHFTYTDKLVSKISRESIDLLKLHFRDDMTAADWQLVKKLKPLFQIA